jgi:hypothetical protein
MSNGSRKTRLIERREELERIDRYDSLIVQEHLLGTEYSLAMIRNPQIGRTAEGVADG